LKNQIFITPCCTKSYLEHQGASHLFQASPFSSLPLPLCKKTYTEVTRSSLPLTVP